MRRYTLDEVNQLLELQLVQLSRQLWSRLGFDQDDFVGYLQANGLTCAWRGMMSEVSYRGLGNVG
jgi:hypothetical protein